MGFTLFNVKASEELPCWDHHQDIHPPQAPAPTKDQNNSFHPAKLPRLEGVSQAMTSPQLDFFRKYAPYALANQKITRIPASVTLAQAALESGFGKHAPENNFFGIKGRGPAGSQWLWTWEYQGGRRIRIRAPFRKYHDPLESFLDHARLIQNNKYFQAALKHTHNPRAFVEALQSGKRKYATDPNYMDKILRIIQTYQLERLDA